MAPRHLLRNISILHLQKSQDHWDINGIPPVWLWNLLIIAMEWHLQEIRSSHGYAFLRGTQLETPELEKKSRIIEAEIIFYFKSDHTLHWLSWQSTGMYVSTGVYLQRNKHFMNTNHSPLLNKLFVKREWIPLVYYWSWYKLCNFLFLSFLMNWKTFFYKNKNNKC